MNENSSTRPLKIAIILDKFMPSRGGERYFSLLASGLAGKGHEVHVFTARSEVDAEKGPFKVHIVPAIRRPRSLHILSFMSALTRVLSDFDFDIIHGEMPSKVLDVYNPHGGVEKAYLQQEFASIVGHPLYRRLRWLKHHLSPRHYLETRLQVKMFENPRATKIIAVSRMVERDIQAYHHVETGRIRVIFDSVDLARFHPTNKELFRHAIRASLGLDPERPVLLFASNNYRLKGLATLLAALAHLKQRAALTPFLLVAGRGKALPYQRIAQKMGIMDHVRFLGQVRDMERYYGASDVYVHPTFYDSCGLTILEALATGIPVVTTDFAGAAYAVQHGISGFVLPDPSDSITLSMAIESCLDPDFADPAGEAARTSALRYSVDRNIEETLEVYHDVIAKKARTG